MIQSFGDGETEKLFHGMPIKQFEAFERIARRKLEMVNASVSVTDLKVPPGNRLERLKGNRSKYYSIRINDQWRICFIWKDGGAYEAEIEDYH